jgi:hypothetical protein
MFVFSDLAAKLRYHRECINCIWVMYVKLLYSRESRLAILPCRDARPRRHHTTDVLKGLRQPTTFDLLCSVVIAARVGSLDVVAQLRVQKETGPWSKAEPERAFEAEVEASLRGERIGGDGVGAEQIKVGGWF